MIVSGKWVVLLDPSRRYLPLTKSSGIRIRLQECSMYDKDKAFALKTLLTLRLKASSPIS